MTIATLLTSVIVTVVPVGTISPIGECGKDWYGQYHVNQSKIEVCTRNYHVITHEYGHVVWFEYMNDKQRAQYTRLWQRSPYKTTISGGTVEEDFAEAYVLYREKFNDKGYGPRIAFIRKLHR